MTRIAVVVESIDFRQNAAPLPCRVAVVEIDMTEEEMRATEGPVLENAERRIWDRIGVVCGKPPAGYSSWLGANKWFRVPA